MSIGAKLYHFWRARTFNLSVTLRSEGVYSGEYLYVAAGPMGDGSDLNGKYWKKEAKRALKHVLRSHSRVNSTCTYLSPTLILHQRNSFHFHLPTLLSHKRNSRQLLGGQNRRRKEILAPVQAPNRYGIFSNWTIPPPSPEAS